MHLKSMSRVATAAARVGVRNRIGVHGRQRAPRSRKTKGSASSRRNLGRNRRMA